MSFDWLLRYNTELDLLKDLFFLVFSIRYFFSLIRSPAFTFVVEDTEKKQKNNTAEDGHGCYE